MTVLSYGLSLSNAGFTGPMRVAQGTVSTFTGALSKAGNIITGLANLPGAIETLVAPLSRPITLSADAEALETSLKALLKSAPAAKAMVKDLMEFADVTPFDPVPVAATGKQLLAFGFAAKQIKPLLRDIGDLAAGMDKPIEEVGDAFGRLKAGQFGEAFERLRAFGISMQDLTGAGLKFDKSGSFQGSADEALDAVRQIIRRKFGGGMQDLSTTFRGLFSTFQGYWDSLQRSFGTPIMKALEPVLEEATTKLKDWLPLAENLGKTLATGISGAFALFKSGQLGKTIETAASGLAKAMLSNVNVGISTAIRIGAEALKGAFQSAATLLSDGNFWEGIRGSVMSILDTVRAELMSAAADLIELLPVSMRFGANVAGLREGADKAGMDAKYASSYAAEQFGMIDMEQVMSPLLASAQKSGSILADAITTVAGNTRNIPELAQVAESLKTAAASSATAQTTLSEMAREARASALLSGASRREFVQTPTGGFEKIVPLLNPQAIERLLNPGKSSDTKTSTDLKRSIDDSGLIKRLLDVLEKVQANTSLLSEPGAFV